MTVFTPRFTITNRITADLTTIERARGFLEAATISEDWVRRMSQRALLLEAHHTTHIEGTQLSVEQAEQVWTGQHVKEANADDVRELLNYRAAFDLVSEYLTSGAPISEGLVREIHKRLVEGVRGGRAKPGEWRTVQNYVANSRTGEIIYTPPPAGEVPALMRQLIEWLRDERAIHPVLMAGIAQFQLVHIHPFVDGNGRASRLLSTLCLYRTGYDFKRLFTISEYYDRDRAAFYAALQGVRKAGMDLTGWLEFFVAGLATQLQEVRTKGEQAIRADVLAREKGLNARQTILVGVLLERGSLTLADAEHLLPDVTRRTLQRDLKQLVNVGLVIELGRGRTDPMRSYRWAAMTSCDTEL
ncbi:MAG: Fic family protein [Polyangiaceae bacterium]|nr:Fic family protein [Polyangiaceae bacterium]